MPARAHGQVVGTAAGRVRRAYLSPPTSYFLPPTSYRATIELQRHAGWMRARRGAEVLRVGWRGEGGGQA